MRLDSLDKAPVVSPTDGLGADFKVIALPQAAATAAPAGVSTATSDHGQKEQKRLAKIIFLVDEAQKRKAAQSKKSDKQAKAKAASAYLRVALGFTEETKGQAIDLKV